MGQYWDKFSGKRLLSILRAATKQYSTLQVQCKWMNIICILIRYWLRTCKIRIAYSRQDCMQAHSRANPARIQRWLYDVIIPILLLCNTRLATSHCVFGWIREFGQFSSERLPTFRCICSRYQQSRYQGSPQMHSQITILLLILSNISVPEQKDLSKLGYWSGDLWLSAQAPSLLSRVTLIQDHKNTSSMQLKLNKPCNLEIRNSYQELGIPTRAGSQLKPTSG